MKLIQPRGVCHTLVTELTHKQITLIFFFFFFFWSRSRALRTPAPAPRHVYDTTHHSWI